MGRLIKYLSLLILLAIFAGCGGAFPEVESEERAFQGHGLQLGDPACRPLEENAVTYLKEDTTICPGVYENTMVILQGVEGIQVRGSGVILKGRYQDPAPSPFPKGVIHLVNASQVQLFGFEIQYNGANITLEDSHYNRLSELALTQIDCGEGIVFAQSTHNTLRDSQFVGSFAPLSLLPQSHDNQIENSVFTNPTAPQGCDFFRPAVYVFSQQNRLENNQLNGLGYVVQGQENLLQANTIQQSEVAVILSGSKNTVIENTLQKNQWGVWLKASHNQVQGNDLSLNTEACWLEDTGLVGNSLFENACDW